MAEVFQQQRASPPTGRPFWDREVDSKPFFSCYHQLVSWQHNTFSSEVLPLRQEAGEVANALLEIQTICGRLKQAWRTSCGRGAGDQMRGKTPPFVPFPHQESPKHKLPHHRSQG